MLKYIPIFKQHFSTPPLSFLVTVAVAFLFGAVVGITNFLVGVAIIGALIMFIAIILMQDEFMAVVVLIVKLYVDFYLGLAFVAQIITLALLGIAFLTRSASRPWIVPRGLWIWLLFISISIFPALRGINALDSAYYYFNSIFFPLIIFWLGMLLARDALRMQRFFKMVAAFGAFVAAVTILQYLNGMLLFKSARYDAALASLANYQLDTSGVSRAGAYLINPDSNGAFLALMLLIPIGLLATNLSFTEKIICCLEIALLSFALLTTYSTAGWIGAFVGILLFLVLVGNTKYRLQFLAFCALTILLLVLFFPAQINLQLQHATAPSETRLRIAAWQTGIQVIRAFPLGGLGIGRYVYYQRADPYRVPEQFVPLDHPHNSYLELAALGGIPVSALFIVLLLFAMVLALRNWVQSNSSMRSLLAIGLAVTIALTFNSLANPGWTLPPLSSIGWLVLGVVSSPLIVKNPQNVAERIDKK